MTRRVIHRRLSWDVNPKALIHLNLAVLELLPRWRGVQYDSQKRPIRVALGGATRIGLDPFLRSLRREFESV